MVNVRYQHHGLLERMLSYCANRLHEFDADSIALAMWLYRLSMASMGVSDMVKRSFVPLSESSTRCQGQGVQKCGTLWES